MANKMRGNSIDYSAADVAAMLGVSKQRVSALCAEGRLPHVRDGKRILFPRLAWELWLAERNKAALAVVREAKR
jgi:excisionase family DNA binding protein